MRRFLFVVLLIVTGCTSAPKKPEPPSQLASETILFSRHFVVTICNKKKVCRETVHRTQPTTNIELKLESFSKGESGVTGADLYQFTEQGVPFNSEIRVVRKNDEPGYYFYMMLRSGPTLAREGKVKTFTVPAISELSETILSDEPINYDGGTLQTKLIVGAAN